MTDQPPDQIPDQILDQTEITTGTETMEAEGTLLEISKDRSQNYQHSELELKVLTRTLGVLSRSSQIIYL